jgi:cephalosporin hydroxylase
MNDLNKLAILFNTDKSSEIHDYCRKYEKYLPFDREDKLKILEIGVFNGGSLKMWSMFYPNSNVIGIDINSDCKQYEDERINIEIGSQVDSDFLKFIINKYGPFDMILDDGSHINKHVIFSFEVLFDAIQSGGVYVVEDSVTSYWKDYGGGKLNPDSMIEYFKRLVDHVNFNGILNNLYKHQNARREDLLIPCSINTQPECRTDIESINFLNSIILITKR